MSQYSELLKHPKWQEKRLRVLEAAGFQCSSCGDKEKTLHVHHGYYERGKKPWEYDDETLHVLCEDCHEATQENLTSIHRLLGRVNSTEDLDRVRGYLGCIQLQQADDGQAWIDSFEAAEGASDACDAWSPDRLRATPHDILAAAEQAGGWLTSSRLSGLMKEARRAPTA